MKFLQATILMSFLFLVSCTSSKMITKQAGNSEELLDKRWNLVKLNGDTVMNGMKGLPFLIFDSSGKVMGNAGCNLLSGNYKLMSTNQMELSDMITTRMYCREYDSLERAFLKVLTQVDHFSIIDNHLLLFDNRTQLAVLEHSFPEALSGKWKLFFIQGDGVDFPGLYPYQKPYIIFDPAKGSRVFGFTGCNSFWSNIHVKEHQFDVVLPGAMTLKACPGDGEKIFMEAWGNVGRYEIEEGILTFFNDDLPVLRFEKVNEM